jgi:hypothetical protein
MPNPVGWECPAGSYCQEGSVAPTPCPPGRYNPEKGKISSNDCLACPPGFICPSFGIIDNTQMQACPAGYYCKDGGAVSGNVNDEVALRICSVGYYCPAGSKDQIACPIGTYNSQKGQTTCALCPAGYQCETAGLEFPLPCEAGSYCPVNSLSG